VLDIGKLFCFGAYILGFDQQRSRNLRACFRPAAGQQTVKVSQLLVAPPQRFGQLVFLLYVGFQPGQQLSHGQVTSPQLDFRPGRAIQQILLGQNAEFEVGYAYLCGDFGVPLRSVDRGRVGPHEAADQQCKGCRKNRQKQEAGLDLHGDRLNE
jgi:hypothetical protein